MIAIGDLTTAIVAYLTLAFDSSEVLVGDGVAPLNAGWSEGTPNTAAGFTPYVVVKAGTTISLPANTPLCSTAAVLLNVPYMVIAYENSRVAADALASDARGHLKSFPVPIIEVGDLRFNTSHMFVDSMSGAVRDDSVHPKMWSAVTNLRASVAWTQG